MGPDRAMMRRLCCGCLFRINSKSLKSTSTCTDASSAPCSKSHQPVGALYFNTPKSSGARTCCAWSSKSWCNFCRSCHSRSLRSWNSCSLCCISAIPSRRLRRSQSSSSSGPVTRVARLRTHSSSFCMMISSCSSKSCVFKGPMALHSRARPSGTEFSRPAKDRRTGSRGVSSLLASSSSAACTTSWQPSSAISVASVLRTNALPLSLQRAYTSS
mmetsp:Transcript_95283/g.278577  ORF Transcript_95283/g.278577 Transcript_95283/m.278577 type:complete len:215 (+) Transcript_95283:694-1338(+)